LIIRFRKNPLGERGEEVHASSYIRKRQIVLDSALLDHSPELIRIMVHEVFHFVWTRLDNRSRREWEAVVTDEFARKIPGELGYSAALRKERLMADGRGAIRNKLWRDYVCESFCDTAAWCFSARTRHDEVDLPVIARKGRERYFRALLARRVLPV
jgi:hypothetical protein